MPLREEHLKSVLFIPLGLELAPADVERRREAHCKDFQDLYLRSLHLTQGHIVYRQTALPNGVHLSFYLREFPQLNLNLPVAKAHRGLSDGFANEVRLLRDQIEGDPYAIALARSTVVDPEDLRGQTPMSVQWRVIRKILRSRRRRSLLAFEAGQTMEGLDTIHRHGKEATVAGYVTALFPGSVELTDVSLEEPDNKDVSGVCFPRRILMSRPTSWEGEDLINSFAYALDKKCRISLRVVIAWDSADGQPRYLRYLSGALPEN